MPALGVGGGVGRGDASDERAQGELGGGGGRRACGGLGARDGQQAYSPPTMQGLLVTTRGPRTSASLPILRDSSWWTQERMLSEGRRSGVDVPRG